YLGLVLAAVSMVGGYALFDSIMNGVGACLAGRLGNFMQNVFGLVVGYVLYKVFPESLKKMAAVK
ncbi:ECF transporter S component, partial [Alistipes putredinis]|nr:ECF transporter S component [Alistipes putredinis]